MIETVALTGEALAAALDDVARLRIEVFRDFPYLYDGDMGYERDYLESYRTSPGAILVAALADGQLVGASTGTPLAEHAEDFAQAFASTGLALEDIFYCAESVLRQGWRGHGIGHRFFDLREAHAKALGLRYSAFCAVIRPDDHPARPESYRPLDGFWQARGYEKLPGVTAQFEWRDIGATSADRKSLQFWMREL